jgi:DNA-binding transcriptional ArsR family regulator
VQGVLRIGVLTPHAASGPEVELPAMAPGRVLTCVARVSAEAAARGLVVDPTTKSGSSSSHRGPAIVNLMVQYYTTVDRAFAALADPTRRAVLERLGAGSATISELAEPFGMSLTGMKKHVRLLEEARLVTTEKIGRVRRCMLAPYAFEGISTWLQRLDRFAQVVERTKGAP